jgi:hypothetical protein
MKQTNGSCATVPQFDRLRYFYGQMLHARDLQMEQAYSREKLKLHNRCLHGWGVVCGLDVSLPPAEPDCPPQTDAEYERLRKEIAEREKAAAGLKGQELRKAREEIEALKRRLAALGTPTDCAPEKPRTTVVIGCGVALDCEGNEIVVRQPIVVDLWSLLPHEDRQQAEGEPTTIYVGLCYRECPIEPTRPIVQDACGATAACTFGKLRDSLSVVVTTDDEQWHDARCDPCCQPSGACCVLLARIDGFVRGDRLTDAQVHPEVRRMVLSAARPPTTIVGINWAHGGLYTPAQASQLLGTGSTNSGGLVLKFSRPLRSETIVDGVVDTWVLEGGRGRAAAISNKAGLIEKPAGPTTDTIVYRDETSETLNYGDRVLVIVRGAFLLDDCCQPVDGAHVGGRVPMLPDSPEYSKAQERTGCAAPPRSRGVWTSGDGGAANFESWFWIGQP